MHYGSTMAFRDYRFSQLLAHLRRYEPHLSAYALRLMIDRGDFGVEGKDWRRTDGGQRTVRAVAVREYLLRHGIKVEGGGASQN